MAPALPGMSPPAAESRSTDVPVMRVRGLVVAAGQPAPGQNQFPYTLVRASKESQDVHAS